MKRLVYLTAGAGGMFCGSCLNDNAMAKALPGFGWDTQLVPCYTPIRTDGPDVSIDQVFFGGINVWLQQKIPVFRWLPQFADRMLDNPRFIRRITSRAMETDARFLGSLALSMLRGVQGNQKKEVRRLVRWLVHSAKPDVIVVTNILIAAFADELRRNLDVPVVVMLQGDDVFLRQLPPADLKMCLVEIQRIAHGITAFVTHSQNYRDEIRSFLGIGSARFEVVPLGIEPQDFLPLAAASQPPDTPVMGYLARLAPEKGLHRLVDSFIKLAQTGRWPDLKLRIAGWLSPENRTYAGQQWDKLRAAGLENRFEYRGVVDRAGKMDFFRGLTLLSVPTEQHEPKGLFVLEALAAGVPVVQPDHGAFPELLADLPGGLLFRNASEDDYIKQMAELLDNPVQALRLGHAGHQALIKKRTVEAVAGEFDRLLRDVLVASQLRTES